jgi:hypothetical protein
MSASVGIRVLEGHKLLWEFDVVNYVG